MILEQLITALIDIEIVLVEFSWQYIFGWFFVCIVYNLKKIKYAWCAFGNVSLRMDDTSVVVPLNTPAQS